jgi:glycosyltransferase involved in cell wall biosynthesis
VVACSRYVAEQFPSVHPKVIHSGGDLRSLRQVATREPFSVDPPTVVCVGRLNRWKGQDVLVKALALLRDQGRYLRCRLVGGAFATDGDVEASLVDLIEGLGLREQVQLMGDVADASVFMATADIAVVPSKIAEPFGKVVIEAMALGRPVVATAAGGPLEVIGNGKDGLLVPPDDEVALAAALSRLLDNPSWARSLGEAARLRAMDFGEEEAATAYRLEMEGLVGHRHSRR